MTQNLQRLARRAAPWRPGLAWWVAALQGLVAAALGLWILFAERSAGRAAILLLAVWVGVMVLLEVAGAVRRRGEPDALVVASAGAGLVGGLVVVLQPALESVDEPAARVVLGIALVVSAIGIVLAAALRSAPARARGLAALGGLLYGVLGWLLLTAGAGATALRWLGAVTGVLGLVLLGYALALRNRADGPAPTPQPPLDGSPTG
jgi:hypothetical protein